MNTATALLTEVREKAIGSKLRARIDAYLSGDIDVQITLAIGKAWQKQSVRRQQLIRAFWRFQQETGLSPRLEDLGNALGVSKPTIAEMVNYLVVAGIMSKRADVARGLELVKGRK